MNNKNENEISLDILKHIEDLSNQVNELMAPRAKSVLKRYPIAFGLILLLGVTALHEGLKGVMGQLGLLEMNPWYLLVIGLIILIVTGSVYKKLEK